MRTTDLQNVILKMLGNKRFYGYQLHRKLADDGVKIEISRLYRVLNEMMKARLLVGRWEKSHSGPRKRVYSLGREGGKRLDKMLLEAIKTVHSFYGRYLAQLPSEFNPVSKVCDIVTGELAGRVDIGYVVSTYSGMHERIITELHDRLPQATINFVKPRLMKMDLNLDRLLYLQGSYSDIPMKDDYFDLLLAVGLPRKELLQATMRESRRVVKGSGKFALLTPTALVHAYEDPMTIGDFMEKIEHGAAESTTQVSDKHLQQSLKNVFRTVEERRVIHVSLFVATEPYRD